MAIKVYSTKLLDIIYIVWPCMTTILKPETECEGLWFCQCVLPNIRTQRFLNPFLNHKSHSFGISTALTGSADSSAWTSKWNVSHNMRTCSGMSAGMKLLFVAIPMLACWLRCSTESTSRSSRRWYLKRIALTWNILEHHGIQQDATNFSTRNSKGRTSPVRTPTRTTPVQVCRYF